MPVRILEHNTGTVYLPAAGGIPDPHPELNSLTFVHESGAVHTIHYHSGYEYDDPYDVLHDFYNDKLSVVAPAETAPDEQPTPEQTEGE